MTTLSINLPSSLALASQEVAVELGMSRTEFIRQAIIHELESYRICREQEAMAKSMLAMKKSKNYLSEADEIMFGLNSELQNEEEEWWKKKS